MARGDGPGAYTFTPDERQRMIAQWVAGATLDELAHAYGVSRATIYSMTRGHPRDTAWQDEAAALYESGHSIRAVSEKTGRNRDTIWRIVQRLGVTLRPRGGANNRKQEP